MFWLCCNEQKVSLYISSSYARKWEGEWEAEAELTGSSTSVSVSPAHGWPGAVVMLLGPFGAGPPPNKRLRKLVLDLVLAPAECFELELEAREVYIMLLLSSSRSSPLSSACISCG